MFQTTSFKICSACLLFFPLVVFNAEISTFGTKLHVVYDNAITKFTPIHTRSRIECGRECAMSPHCFGFSFDGEEHECRMINQVVDTSSSGSGKMVKIFEIKRCPTNADGFCRDCKDLLQNGYVKTGKYFINFNGSSPVQLVCDMTTAGGGWSIIQQRFDGSINFYVYWSNYVNGFGNIDVRGEYWLGLESIHRLTSIGRTRMYIELQAFDNTKVYADYSEFSVSDSSSDYTNNVTGYSGTAGDSMYELNNGYPFSTRDRDNSQSGCIHGSCPVTFKGAWWYSCCHYSNLNGIYFQGTHTSWADGINWYYFRGLYESLKQTKMMIRRY